MSENQSLIKVKLGYNLKSSFYNFFEIMRFQRVQKTKHKWNVLKSKKKCSGLTIINKKKDA